MDGAAGAVKSWVALARAVPPGLTVGKTVRIFPKPGFPPSFQDARGPVGDLLPPQLGQRGLPDAGVTCYMWNAPLLGCLRGGGRSGLRTRSRAGVRPAAERVKPFHTGWYRALVCISVSPVTQWHCWWPLRWVTDLRGPWLAEWAEGQPGSQGSGGRGQVPSLMVGCWRGPEQAAGSRPRGKLWVQVRWPSGP